MVQSNFKATVQFLKKNGIYTVINLTGLSIALAVSFVILLYVINEFSYNYCHKKRDRINRVVAHNADFNLSTSGTPYALASALKQEFPQVEKATQTINIGGFKIKLGNDWLNVDQAVSTGSEIIDIFTIPLVEKSDENNLLDDKNAILLSCFLAKKLFPEGSATGQEIEVKINNKNHSFYITGVFEDIPENSTFKPHCLLNSEWGIEDINNSFNLKDSESTWSHDFWQTWILLRDEEHASQIKTQFPGFEKKHLNEASEISYSLQNLTDYYLFSDHIIKSPITGNLKNIKIFSFIALMIVLLAGINYVLLSTTISRSRAKEIGIRKTFGASIKNLKLQLLSESVVITFLALPVSLVIFYFTYAYAGQLFDTNLIIIPNNWWLYLVAYMGVTFLVGLASGLYGAGYLSGLKVVNVFSPLSGSGSKKSTFRTALIVFELVIFCSFIASTLVIYSQYQYFITKHPGFNTQNILFANVGRSFNDYNTFLNDIKSNPNIHSAGGSLHELPMRNIMSVSVPHQINKEEKVVVEGMAVDYNFLETMGIKVVKGRSFSSDFGSDRANSIILNKTAVRELGYVNPVGKKFDGFTIIGVVEDFNLHALTKEIPPLFVSMAPESFVQQIAVYYEKGNADEVAEFLKKTWQNYNPESSLELSSIEIITASLYESERDLIKIVSYATLLSLLISMLGLFGVTLFLSKTRTKEIGIKKVIGCSERTIVFSFLKQNIAAVLLSGVIAVPLTYYFMRHWLNQYAYQVKISYWIFFIAIIMAIIIVSLVVLAHSLKAARANPVDALRDE